MKLIREAEMSGSMPADDPWATPAFFKDIGLGLSLVALGVAFLALTSYSPLDPAWSTTGSDQVGGQPAFRNWLARPGAWFADGALFWAGYSVWWLWLALAASCLRGLLRRLKRPDSWTLAGGEAVPVSRPHYVASPTDRQGWQYSRWAFWLGLAVLLVSSAALEWSHLYRLEPRLPGHAGGVAGYLAGPWLNARLGFIGAGLLLIALVLSSSSLALRFSWLRAAEHIGQWFDHRIQARRDRREVRQDVALGRQAARQREEVVQAERGQMQERPPGPVLIEPSLAPAGMSSNQRVTKERQKPLFTEMPDNKLPQVDLLDAGPGQQETVSRESLEMTSRLIEKKLADFGVQVRVVVASPGPVITRYEIEPATGVKGSQIVNLAKDLARSLSLVSIRVIETIPGKNYMALELPNARRQMIRLTEILGSQIYNEAKSMLTIALGKDIIGNPVVADLARMPHVLVAGTTGSGKSVGINGMILSLLYKAEARDVRLLMIDPKMLEMSVYEGIPHLLAPVVTDMKQAANGLAWCVAEMERRYKLMSKLGVRNLAGFNAKLDEAKVHGEFISNPLSLTPNAPEPLERLPHIVVVIDELADLMMVVGKKIEELIARLAQKARAAGIHLILATQRPSVDVITGLIKANIPTRIAFQVSSKIDSRTILDQMGAEALLGMGDMLYLPSGTGLPIRVHGAFVSDEEVHRVVQYLKAQGLPNYIEGVLEGGAAEGDDGALGEPGSEGGEKDPLYDQAVEVVLKNRKASISLVQRHLKIGYNRSARLVEDMENAGLVSAMNGAGQREILVPLRGD